MSCTDSWVGVGHAGEGTGVVGRATRITGAPNPRMPCTSLPLTVLMAQSDAGVGGGAVGRRPRETPVSCNGVPNSKIDRYIGTKLQDRRTKLKIRPP